MTSAAEKSPTTELTPVRSASTIPGEPGLWLLIFLEWSVFSAFFAAVAYLSHVDPAMVEASRRSLNQAIGLINTILLLTGSLFVACGVHDVRGGNWLEARRWFRLGIVCSVSFGFDKAIEYSQKLSHGITPLTNDFYGSYFILTGLHMLHVVVAAFLIAVMIRYSTPETGLRKLKFIDGAACFWHLVDIIWLGLYSVFYLL